MYYTTLAVPNDTLYIAATDNGLCYVGNDADELLEAAKKRTMSLTHSDAEMSTYVKAFDAYFNGTLKTFHVLLDVVGTELQCEVWQALQKIPYGDVWTYEDVAHNIGRPTAVRAVANAIGRNPVLIVVPCHRVIGKNGKLTGFRSGLEMKKTLLSIEGITQYKE